MEELEIPVVGMGCSHCVTKINKAVEKLAGVEKFQISLEHARLRISFDAAETSLSDIREAVQQAGYDLDLRAFDTSSSVPQPEHDCSKEQRR